MRLPSISRFDVHGVVVEDGAVAVDVADVALDAALEVVVDLLAVALVVEMEPGALREEGVLAQAVSFDGEVERSGVEDLLVGLEGDGRAEAAAVLQLLRGELVQRLAAGVVLAVDLAGGALALGGGVRNDLDPHLLGEGVDDAGADAVEAAGHLVAATAEFAPGVEDGHDGLDGGLTGLLLDAHGDAATVVANGAPAVGPEDDLDPVAEAGHGLIDGVVDELLDEVVEAGLIGGPDVHAGPAADRFETLQHLDIGCGVGARGRLFDRHTLPCVDSTAGARNATAGIVRIPVHFITRRVLKASVSGARNGAFPPILTAPFPATRAPDPHVVPAPRPRSRGRLTRRGTA